MQVGNFDTPTHQPIIIIIVSDINVIGEESAEQESKRFKRQTLSVRSMKSKKSMNMKSLRRYQSYADAQWLDYVPPLSKVM